MANLKLKPGVITGNALKEVFALLASGRIQAKIGARVPLSQAAKGLRLAESGTLVGKVVLIQDLS